jgi:ElaB/YqjD/DUF883 family membrane-anchored ribosome-binding protein
VDHELEVIRDQMEETRASLADKLEALESQVRETVQSASETVTSAVDGAKEVVSSVTEGAKQVVDQVSETVDTVKEKLDVTRYVERYPWASLGVAVAAGFCAGQLLPSWSTIADKLEAAPSAFAGHPAAESQPWSTALKGAWDTAASTVEGLAVGTLMAAIKDLANRSLPQQWQSDVNRMVDDVTTRLGGKVMQGNPLNELLSAFQGQQPENQSSGIQSHPSTSSPMTGAGARL